MTDTLTQRARDVAGRLKDTQQDLIGPIPDMGVRPGAAGYSAIAHAYDAGRLNRLISSRTMPEAAAIISELVERIEGVEAENTELRDADRVHLSAKRGMETRLKARIADLESVISTRQNPQFRRDY